MCCVRSRLLLSLGVHCLYLMLGNNNKFIVRSARLTRDAGAAAGAAPRSGAHASVSPAPHTRPHASLLACACMSMRMHT